MPKKRNYLNLAVVSQLNSDDSDDFVVRREVRRIEYMVHRDHDARTVQQFPSRKGRGPHERRAYNRSRRVGQWGNRSGVFARLGPRPRLAVTDEDVTESDASWDFSSKNKFTPCGRPAWKGDGWFQRERRQGRGGGRGGRGGDRGGGRGGGRGGDRGGGRGGRGGDRGGGRGGRGGGRGGAFRGGDGGTEGGKTPSGCNKADGHDLPLPTGFDVEMPTTVSPCKGSCFVNDEIKGRILRFLQDYFSVYDSGNRQPLLDAYHNEANFSITTQSPQNPSTSSLGESSKNALSLRSIKDSSVKLHTRLKIVAFLNGMPKTQHDISSFVIDVNTCTNTLLSFTVSGVFKKAAVDGKSQESTLAFSRVFTTVPAGNSGLCIVNDQSSIRMATREEFRRAFATPALPSSSSPVPTLTPLQQEMLKAFSQKSGMNLEWSQMCLQDNVWDFNKATQIFTCLKAEGKIPQAAFMK